MNETVSESCVKTLPEPEWSWSVDQLGQYVKSCEEGIRRPGTNPVVLKYMEGQALQIVSIKLADAEWEGFLAKHVLTKTTAQAALKFFTEAGGVPTCDTPTSPDTNGFPNGFAVR